MTREELFEAVGSLPDGMILHAEIKSETARAEKSVSIRAARQEKCSARRPRFTFDNRFVAAVSVLVALGVLFAVVRASYIRRDPIEPAPGTEKKEKKICTLVLTPTDEDFCIAENNEAPSPGSMPSITEYHGMGFGDTCTLTFTSLGDGTCVLTDIDINILYENPFTLTIPATSPDGDTVIAIDPNIGCAYSLLYLSDDSFREITNALAAALGEDNCDVTKFKAYYGGDGGMKSVKNMQDENTAQDLLNKYPLLAATDLWVYDSSASLSERVWASNLLYSYVPLFDAMTQYEYLLQLENLAEDSGLETPMQTADFRADGRYVRAVVLPETIQRITVGAFGNLFGLTQVRTDMTVEQMQTIEWVICCETQTDETYIGQETETVTLTGSHPISTYVLTGSSTVDMPHDVYVICADGGFVLYADVNAATSENP